MDIAMKTTRSERICVKVSCVSGEFIQPSDKTSTKHWLTIGLFFHIMPMLMFNNPILKLRIIFWIWWNLNEHRRRYQNIDDDVREYLKILHIEQEIIQLTVFTTKTTCFYKLYCAESLSNGRISVFFALYLELLLVWWCLPHTQETINLPTVNHLNGF